MTTGEFFKNNGFQTVLVTGGSGYLAGWTIVELLKRGYRVRTTVRSLSREGQVRAVIARGAEAGERLSFYAADLLSDQGWDAAVDGADYVLHVASPMNSNKADLVTPARDGTLRVLRAATKAGVKRVVITSSGVAARLPEKADPATVIDERVWTDLNDPDIDEYTRSKTLSEKAAFDFMAEQGGATTLASVLPVFVEGPVLDKSAVSASVELVARVVSGKLSAIPRFGLDIVDTRDLVDLHLRAMTAPEAAGQRFLGSAGFIWLEEVARLLREEFGPRAPKIPSRRMPDWLLKTAGLFNEQARFLAPRLGKKPNISAAKAEKVLGWQPRPLKNTLVDTAESLLKEGVV
ncbi:MAG: aldehyde reductase [Chloroflexi bacterium]|nr:aldehyde reductase [Chloroflexota bacterium]OJW00692.1 MAG: epimerase [Chloroflexi bacterium 54-19]